MPAVKHLPTNAADGRDMVSIPGLGRSPGLGSMKWQPTLVFLPGKFHWQRSLVGYSPWGCRESDMTEWAHSIYIQWNIIQPSKKKEIAWHAITWINLEDTLLSGSESHSVVSNSLRPHGLYSPWNSPGQNTGVGSLSLLQGIFPTQGLNPCLPHCRQILYQLSHKGNPVK